VSFRIDTLWMQDAVDNQVDVAQISMSAQDQMLTQLVDRNQRTNREYFEASGLSLAFWFADNWWRLRHETLGDLRYPSVDWRLRHEMSSAAGGTLWPPFMIYGVGERVTLAMSLNPRQAAGPTRYLDFAPLAIDGADYESGLDRFFDEVGQHCRTHVDGAAFLELLGQLNRERRDPDVAAWRVLEACLGFDPDAAPASVIETMAAYEARVGESAVEEAAVAAPGADSPARLGEAIEASEASAIVVDFTTLGTIDPRFKMQSGALPWHLAENAARLVHERLGKPGTLAGERLTDLLKIRADDFTRAPATARYLPYGARLVERDRNHLAMQMEPERFRRFEIARMIGDELWSRDAPFGVVSRAKSDRQKFQRAFAKALLCPFPELRRHIDLDRPTRAQISAAADHFDVDDSVVHAILVDKGYLDTPSFEDQLETA
jgi:hypothetical protein